jgi:hypothetical protein
MSKREDDKLPHVSDDLGECWCDACTRKLLGLHRQYLLRWIKQANN